MAARDDHPSELRAKMLALLALLDVLDGGAAQMSAVAVEHVGPTGKHAGKVRLQFSVFVEASRTLDAAHELYRGAGDLLTAVDAQLCRSERILLATRMIAAWTDLIARLCVTPALPAVTPEPDVEAVHKALGPARRRLPERT